MHAIDLSHFVSRRTAAQRLSVSERTIDRWIVAGRIRHARVGWRSLILVEEVDRLAAELQRSYAAALAPR